MESFHSIFSERVAEIIRKGEPVLRKISHTLDELKQLLQLVPKKSLLKSGLKNMIEHLEAADTVGRSCNFKFGTAETEMTEDVPLPRDDTIVTGHSRKRSLPSQKGCEPSPKKSKSETVTTATTGESSMTVTTTTPPPPPPWQLHHHKLAPDHKQELPQLQRMILQLNLLQNLHTANL